MKIGISGYRAGAASGVLTLCVLVAATSVHAQSAANPLALVPANQQALLKQRLLAYTEAFRLKDWAGLYDLVSHVNKVDVLEGKLKVTKRIFVRDMQGTYDPQWLIKFTPVRTEPGDMPSTYDIYGCGKVPFGNQRSDRIAAVRAVWEQGNWFFENWDYAEPPEECSHLDAAWKPGIKVKLDGPMLQVSCELFTCTL
jgi:hypothetical protein